MNRLVSFQSCVLHYLLTSAAPRNVSLLLSIRFADEGNAGKRRSEYSFLLIYRLIMMLLEFKSLSTVTSETWVNTCVRLIACQSFTNRLSLGAWIDFT